MFEVLEKFYSGGVYSNTCRSTMAMYTVDYVSDAPDNQQWQVFKTTDTINKAVSKHRLKKNAVSKARSLKGAGDSGVIMNKNNRSKPL